MREFIRLSYFFSCLLDEMENQLYGQGYSSDDVTEGLYSLIKVNDDNFSSYGSFFDGYDKFSCYDLKKLLIDYMYAVYGFSYLSDKNYVKSEDTNDNEDVFSSSQSVDCDDIIISMMNDYESSNFVFEEYFDEYGFDLVDNILWFNCTKDSSKYYMSSMIKRDEEFNKMCSNSIFLSYLYNYCRTIKVTEENLLIEYFFRTCENLDIYTSDNLSYLSKKLKDFLILKGLVFDLNSGENNRFFRHFFSVVINNIYSEIVFSNDHRMRPISKVDKKFFKTMDSRSVSFESLLQRFIKDEKFSYYILKSFFEANIDADDALIYARNKYVNENSDYVKVKKYFSD